MSNIVIIVGGKNLSINVLGALHKLLEEPLSKVRSALSEGSPLLEIELFDNNYDEKAALLRSLIKIIRQNGLASEVYELPSGRTFENGNLHKRSLISLEILENILDAADCNI